MSEYGVDFHCVDDFDANLSTVSGPLVVIEAVVRRLQTPRGGLWYDRDYGTDLRAFLNGSRSRFRVASAVEQEARKDERVEAAEADVTFTDATMRVDLSLTLEDGVFDLVLNVSALTVELVTFG